MNRKSMHQSGIQRGGSCCEVAISADAEWAGELAVETRTGGVDSHGNATVIRALGIVT